MSTEKHKNDEFRLNPLERLFQWAFDNFFGISMTFGMALLAAFFIWAYFAISYQNSPEGVTERCLSYELFTVQECEIIVKWERLTDE